MLGRWIVAATLVVASTASGALTFVSPQSGAQAIGPQIVEVTADATNIDRVEFHVDGILAGVARMAPYRIAFDFGTDLRARAIRATVFSNGYRDREFAEITTAALTAGDSINVDLVEVPMRIRSPRAVKPQDLRVKENGVEQTVRDVIATRPPAHFAFVVDRSLSMGGGKLEAALRAIDAIRPQLRAGDTASLVLFNHHVARPVALRGGSDAIAALQSTVPSGGTSLRDAVASTKSNGAARTYVVVVTDGGDRHSALSEEAALRKMSGTKSVVSAITFSDASPFLERAASATGGSLRRATAETVRSALASMIEDINSRYTLIYQSSGTAPGWRSISVTAKSRRVTVASARTRYFSE